MRLINLSNKSDKDYIGLRSDESDYDTLINENATVYKPDGSLLCVILKNVITVDSMKIAWPVLDEINTKTNNRGVATGEGMIVKNKQRISAMSVNSSIIGYFERTARMPYCRACSWNLNNPEKWQDLLPMIKEVDAMLKKHAPVEYEFQAKVAKKSHKDFLIKDTHFSTLTVNKNFRTAYHKDAGNIKGGISALTVHRKGRWTGANLVFPNYRIAAKLDTFDMIIFDPHEVHGNTNMIKLSKDASRCSVVYYFRELIQQCLSAEDELNIVKNRKQGESLFETKLRKNEKNK